METEVDTTVTTKVGSNIEALLERISLEHAKT